MKKQPLISIITVVFNNKKGLEETMKSVISQSYKNFEYIVIDGASTDGTLDIIKKYHQHITTYISEPDRGIYDAMNKGIDLAKGEYIYFLNSGDTFYNNTILEKASDKLSSADMLYGDIIWKYPNYDVYVKSKFSNLNKGHSICHQAAFVKTSILKNRKFNLMYRSASDFDLMTDLWLNNYIIKKIGLCICTFESGGFSSNKNISYQEHFKIILKKFGKYYAYSFYFRKIILEQGLKKLLITLRLNFIYQYLLKMKLQKQK